MNLVDVVQRQDPEGGHDADGQQGGAAEGYGLLLLICLFVAACMSLLVLLVVY